MQLIEELATTPYGANAKFDDILNHVILVFNVIQNPDGRVAGTRANGNGFDMNRDFLTQSQSEVRATVAQIQKWLPVEVLDLHGYVTPTLIEATTKPHNPSIEYDLWLKWNQDRIDSNEAAMNAAGFDVTRPINDWCADGSIPVAGICDDGTDRFGPQWAESWDDWGPFYTPMYAQHVGLDGSTVEMCNQTDGDCGIPGDAIAETPGRLGSFEIQYNVTTSSLEYVSANRNEMLHDEAERYRRGVAGEARVDCCDPPFDVDNNWMKEFPDAYVIPVDTGQRSNAEAKRLVDWLLRNGIEVDTLRFGTTFDGVRLRQGLVRRLDGPGASRARRHGAEHRPRRLRPDQHPLRASRGLEPRLPLGRRHRRDPARLRLLAGHEPDHQDDDASGRRRGRPCRRLCARARLGDGRARRSTR